MFGADDARAFFADMGVPVVYKNRQLKAILDTPGASIDLGGVQVRSNDYSLTFATADMPDLTRGSALTADGANYEVRSVDQEDDGQTSRAVLKKV